jgi:hypothetical protein
MSMEMAMLTESVSACDDFSALVGKRIDAYFHDDGYWHVVVALRAEGEQSLVFSTEDRGLAKYFEVFPLKFAIEATEQRRWVAFEPLLVESVVPLWRLEWLEPTEDNGQFLGSGPHHVHHAGAGPVSSSAVHAARVLAGVKLADGKGRAIVVSASDSAVFNVDIAVEPTAVVKMLGGFSDD